MAGVKYIKKTPGEAISAEEKPAPAGRKAKATSSAPITKANTKAKVTKKPTKNAAPVSPPSGKSKGRPKATKPTAVNGTKTAKPTKEVKETAAKAKTSAAKTNGEPRKKPGPKPKKEAVVEVEKPKPSRKRKAEEEETAAAPVKKVKTVSKGAIINEKPTQRLHVYVFGEGSSGELGLGTAKTAIDVKRPRLNANLGAENVGVVQIATGGMHVAALTHNNKILTWGVNDQGALGRDTSWEGGLKDMDDNKDDDESDDSDDDTGMNPHESMPTAIPSDKFAADTVFVQVAASDSATFALTDDGQVWGWGTFRSNEGILGFTDQIHIQREPMLLPALKKIKKIACGSNHVLALDATGAVFAWGSGQQNQLGRRVVERTKAQGLLPREFGLPRRAVKDIECGSYHSFAIDNKDSVWSWGLNNFGETGILESLGEDDAAILKPGIVEALSGKGVTCIKGGGHHSIAITGNGDCLTWGRLDGDQIGIPISEIPQENLMMDEKDRPRIVKIPTKVKTIPDPVSNVTAGSEHCLAITRNGQAYAWGFSSNYQTGLGTTEDVTVATLIDNTAVRGKKLDKAYAGGQFGILTAPAEDVKMVNGTNGAA